MIKTSRDSNDWCNVYSRSQMLRGVSDSIVSQSTGFPRFRRLLCCPCRSTILNGRKQKTWWTSKNKATDLLTCSFAFTLLVCVSIWHQLASSTGLSKYPVVEALRCAHQDLEVGKNASEWRLNAHNCQSLHVEECVTTKALAKNLSITMWLGKSSKLTNYM